MSHCQDPFFDYVFANILQRDFGVDTFESLTFLKRRKFTRRLIKLMNSPGAKKEFERLAAKSD